MWAPDRTDASRSTFRRPVSLNRLQSRSFSSGRASPVWIRYSFIWSLRIVFSADEVVAPAHLVRLPDRHSPPIMLKSPLGGLDVSQRGPNYVLYCRGIVVTAFRATRHQVASSFLRRSTALVRKRADVVLLNVRMPALDGDQLRDGFGPAAVDV